MALFLAPDVLLSRAGLGAYAPTIGVFSRGIKREELTGLGTSGGTTRPTETGKRIGMLDASGLRASFLLGR